MGLETSFLEQVELFMMETDIILQDLVVLEELVKMEVDITPQVLVALIKEV
jgi:hypothetical protein